MSLKKFTQNFVLHFQVFWSNKINNRNLQKKIKVSIIKTFGKDFKWLFVFELDDKNNQNRF